MVLWYDDGYRSLPCTSCKKRSRSTHWKCDHGKLRHKCEIHRVDPEEHQTTRAMNGAGGMRPRDVQSMLPSTRPDPISKRQKVSRAMVVAAMSRKRVVQSANPINYRIDLAKCPKLAMKFPHLYSANMSEISCESVRLLEPESDVHVSDAASIQPTTGVTASSSALSPPVVLVVQKTVRKFRYPAGSVATSPCGTMLPLREGSVRTEGRCTEPPPLESPRTPRRESL